MKRKFLCLWMLSLSLLPFTPCAEPAPNQAAVKQRIKQTLGTGNVFRRAIDDAYARGHDLGELPADPAALGLGRPEKYAHRFVAGVRHDRTGRVTISFRASSELGEAAGRTLVLAPTPLADRRTLDWRVSEESTVPRPLLPLDVTVSGQPIFRDFAASTPLLAAFRHWHRAVVTGDYRAWSNLSADLPGATEPLRRAAFAHLSVSMPPTFRISEPEELPTGAVQFQAMGCKDGLRRMGTVYGRQEGGTYKFFTTAWAPPWNKSAEDCPL